VYTLLEQSDGRDHERLARAWARDETFVLLPAKSPVPAAWVEDRLRLLPERFQTDHFGLLTSGSTGRPKLIVGERARATALARVIHAAQDNEPATETVLALPVSYSFAFVNQWVWATAHDRELVPTRGFADPGALRLALRATSAGMICLVGIHVALLTEYFPEERFEGIARVHFAGGRFPQEHLPTLARLFPNARVFNNYGCAEAMPRLTVRAADAAGEAANIGPPLPGIELRAGEGSALQFRSPYRAVAVIEDEVRVIGDEEWIGSGDVAEPVEDGTWRLLGRANEVFKRHGEKVSVPAVLATVHGHFNGQVAAYRDRDRQGEEGWVLVLAPSPSADEVRSVLVAMRRGHGRAQWPLRVESLKNLPLSPNTKVDVAALRAADDREIHWDQRT
jgi:acyl-CoA synthetase (AMP-forming)/AMP-acid ligase II